VALTGDPRLSEPWQAPPGAEVSTALLEAAGAVPAFPAAGFVEKPDLEAARAYLAGSRHLWNTGLFAWPAAIFDEEMAAADPDLARRVAATAAARRDGDETAAASIYAGIEPVPIDTLVFERTRRLTVVRGWFSWSDLGTFADLHVARGHAGEADPGGNIVEGDVISVDSRNSLVLARGGRLVAVVGVDGLAVVDTPDALLVSPLSQSQRVRDVVARLKDEGRSDLL
jgi:mannose-1-phosphate guanylyltransferase